MVLVRCVRVAAAQDRVLEPLPEVCRGAEYALVDKVYERKVFEQVVLDRSPGEKDSSLALETHQRLVGLVLVILQPKEESQIKRSNFSSTGLNQQVSNQNDSDIGTKHRKAFSCKKY